MPISHNALLWLYLLDSDPLSLQIFEKWKPRITDSCSKMFQSSFWNFYFRVKIPEDSSLWPHEKSIKHPAHSMPRGAARRPGNQVPKLMAIFWGWKRDLRIWWQINTNHRSLWDSFWDSRGVYGIWRQPQMFTDQFRGTLHGHIKMAGKSMLMPHQIPSENPTRTKNSSNEAGISTSSQVECLARGFQHLTMFLSQISLSWKEFTPCEEWGDCQPHHFR